MPRLEGMIVQVLFMLWMSTYTFTYYLMSEPQIYVRGFPKYTSEDDLKESFAKFGDVREIRMIRDYAFLVQRI